MRKMYDVALQAETDRLAGVMVDSNAVTGLRQCFKAYAGIADN